MHNQLFFLWIPLLLIILAPVLQVVLSLLKMRGKIKIPLWAINTLSLVLGFILPIVAAIISLYGLPVGIKCAMPCVGVAALGMMLTTVAVPVTGIISYLAYRSKHKTATS